MAEPRDGQGRTESEPVGGAEGAARAPSERTQLRRGAARARYRREEVRAILEEALYCHVGVCLGEQPAVIPTAYALIGDQLYLHGSTANRVFRALRDGAEACISVTLLDGLVLARSAFHHSVNYRSVVIYGRAREVGDPQEKRAAFDALIEHVVPGRSAEVRPANREEFLRTLVLAIPIDEASAKVRSGPPVDDEPDYALETWAGELPLRLVAGAPVPDPRNTRALPASLESRWRALAGRADPPREPAGAAGAHQARLGSQVTSAGQAKSSPSPSSCSAMKGTTPR